MQLKIFDTCCPVHYGACMGTSKLAVDLREAAAILSVSPRTIANYIHAGILPSIRIGKRRVITVRALEEFLRADRKLPDDGAKAAERG